MASVDVRIEGVEKAQASLTAAFVRSQNFLPLFTKAKAEISAMNTANFALGGLPSGGWSPLDPEYGAWKSSRFPGAPPMVRTGKLLASLSGIGPDATFSVTPKSMTLGTKVEYAKFHQYGTTKMPKRKIIFEPAGFAEKYANDAADWVVDGQVT
jgi:phage gpG-like protein